MARYCFISRVAPENIEVYRERHAAVWPDMLRALRDAGWSHYSLFLSDDGLLVGHFDAESREAAQEAMSNTEVNRLWQAEMAKLFVGDGSPDEEFVYLPEVFNLEEQLAEAEGQ